LFLKEMPHVRDTYSISVKKKEKQMTSKIISGQDDLIMSLINL
jgi:hypothetical protein